MISIRQHDSAKDMPIWAMNIQTSLSAPSGIDSTRPINFVTNPLLASLLPAQKSPRIHRSRMGQQHLQCRSSTSSPLRELQSSDLWCELSTQQCADPFHSQLAEENRLGFYLQDEWQRHLRSFTLVAGARYDLDTFIHPTFSPPVSLLYTLIPDHTLHATFSIGYRPPTISNIVSVEMRRDEDYPLPPPINTATFTRQGSTILNPDQIVSYEIGYQGWFLKHRLRLRADLFSNHISDLIFQLYSTSLTTTSFVNARSQPTSMAERLK